MSRPAKRSSAKGQAPAKPKGSSKQASSSSRFTVFLDRDGVFNVHLAMGIRHLDAFEWLPGAREAFARLNRSDVQTALCTNQPWVGQLMATAQRIRSINRHLQTGLAEAGGRLDHIEAAYAPAWFPHRRLKPRPGMLIDAAKHFAALGSPVNPARAVMIGDKLKDAQAAAGFGCKAILLATTYTAAELEDKARAASVEYAAIAPDLEGAVELILSWL